MKNNKLNKKKADKYIKFWIEERLKPQISIEGGRIKKEYNKDINAIKRIIPHRKFKGNIKSDLNSSVPG